MAEPVKCNVGAALSLDHPPDQIQRVDLDLTDVGEPGKLAYLLHNVFTPEECQKLIELTEDAGYTPALVHSGTRAVLAPGYRDSQRVMVDDKEFVGILFKRIGHLLPQIFKTPWGREMELIEINERLRFLRYDPGDEFKPHCDGIYERPDGSACTMITLQIYLNGNQNQDEVNSFRNGLNFGSCGRVDPKDVLEGGETTFLSGYRDKDETKRVAVVPRTGMVLVFEHDLLHEGSLVKAGRKYTIRTDVLYRDVDEEEK